MELQLLVLSKASFANTKLAAKALSPLADKKAKLFSCIWLAFLSFAAWVQEAGTEDVHSPC